MSAGKYSPHVKTDKEFVGVEWKTGTLGYAVEVDADGFDWYGYDENGKDADGKTENYYLEESTRQHALDSGYDLWSLDGEF
jgi:hypothetical protein